MAEIAGFSQAEITAGRKLVAATLNNLRGVFVRTPTTHTALNGDTIGTGVVLKAGTRLGGLPVLSCAAGTASSTLSVGLRNPTTLVAVDATAIINAQAVNAAVVVAPVTGTKLTGGQDYVLPSDLEVYFTVGGANLTANQQISVLIPIIQA